MHSIVVVPDRKLNTLSYVQPLCYNQAFTDGGALEPKFGATSQCVLRRAALSTKLGIASVAGCIYTAAKNVWYKNTGRCTETLSVCVEYSFWACLVVLEKIKRKRTVQHCYSVKEKVLSNADKEIRRSV